MFRFLRRLILIAVAVVTAIFIFDLFTGNGDRFRSLGVGGRPAETGDEETAVGVSALPQDNAPTVFTILGGDFDTGRGKAPEVILLCSVGSRGANIVQLSDRIFVRSSSDRTLGGILRDLGEKDADKFGELLSDLFGVKPKFTLRVGKEGFARIIDSVGGIGATLPDGSICSLSGKEATELLSSASDGESPELLRKAVITGFFEKVKNGISPLKAVRLAFSAYRETSCSVGIFELLPLIRTAIGKNVSDCTYFNLCGEATSNGERSVVCRGLCRDVINNYIAYGSVSEDAFDRYELMTEPSDPETEKLYRFTPTVGDIGITLPTSAYHWNDRSRRRRVLRFAGDRSLFVARIENRK